MLIVVFFALGLIFGYLTIGLTIPILIGMGLTDTIAIRLGVGIGVVIVAISTIFGWKLHLKDSTPR